MITHIMADGTILESIKDHVVTEETLYQVIEQMEEKK